MTLTGSSMNLQQTPVSGSSCNWKALGDFGSYIGAVPLITWDATPMRDAGKVATAIYSICS
jgi:hypothetical protein